MVRSNAEVIAIDANGSPQTVRVNGTCRAGMPACTFSVTLRSRGKAVPTIAGAVREVKSQRSLSR